MSDSKARFFLPPDDYEILRFGGESVKDEEKGKTDRRKTDESGAAGYDPHPAETQRIFPHNAT